MRPSAPQLHRPRPPLSDYVDYIGYWARTDGPPHFSRALPRGAATVVIDIGGRDRLDFFAADGSTQVDVAPAFVAGPGDTSYVTRIDPGQAVMTIHFRPAGASPLLGIPLGDLTNACVDLTEVWGRTSRVLREHLTTTPSRDQRIAILHDYLLARLKPSSGVLARVLATAERVPAIRVSDAVTLTGLSPKRLISAFRDEVGMTPKAYLRVRRLQAALRLLDAGTADGTRIAAELGYFDQAHFIREFRSYTSMTPTQYLKNRDWLPGHVGLTR